MPDDLAGDATSALALTAFERDAETLDEDGFEKRHGHAFLLHEGELDPTRRAHRPQATLILSQGGLTSSSPLMPRPSRKVLVYPVKNTGRSPFPRIVTVGRTKNNDIVLADVSISKFHAFFKEEGGAFVLSDGESRNGTFVEGQRVPTSKQGKPVALTFGQTIKFGALTFRFVAAAELRTLVRHLT